MSVQSTRGADLVAFIEAAGGEIMLTNKAIAEALGFGIGPSRVAELITELTNGGHIVVTRCNPHPKDNPSGRIITVVAF